MSEIKQGSPNVYVLRYCM